MDGLYESNVRGGAGLYDSNDDRTNSKACCAYDPEAGCFRTLIWSASHILSLHRL
jgi:hypothetical protein